MTGADGRVPASAGSPTGAAGCSSPRRGSAISARCAARSAGCASAPPSGCAGRACAAGGVRCRGGRGPPPGGGAHGWRCSRDRPRVAGSRRCGACGCAVAATASGSAPTLAPGPLGRARALRRSRHRGGGTIRQAVRRRRLIAAAASLAVAALSAPAAHAAGVVVRVGRPRDADRRGHAARRRRRARRAPTRCAAQAGPATRSPIRRPSRCRALLELAGVAPDALSFVSVRRPNGTLAVLRARRPRRVPLRFPRVRRWSGSTPTACDSSGPSATMPT